MEESKYKELTEVAATLLMSPEPVDQAEAKGMLLVLDSIVVEEL